MASTNGSTQATEKDIGSQLVTDNVVHLDLRGTPTVNPVQITNWILSNTPITSLFRKTKRPIGEVFVEAAQKSNVNVYYLAAHAALETGWGDVGDISKDKYNFFGIGAFDSSAYASAYQFEGGIEGGIIAGAIWISQNYVNSTKYNQNTLYKMRWGNKDHQYASDKEWDKKIAAIMVSSPMNPAYATYDFTDAAKNMGSSNTYEPIYNGRTIQGPGGVYDGEIFDGLSGVYDKPTFVPPHYYEDNFGQLLHRYTQGDFFIRIGDSRFVIPPTRIRISENTNIQKFQSIRMKQSMKVQAGNRMKTIDMTLMFTDFDQINGYTMEGPDWAKSGVYHMDGLRSLIAQMKTMPFLPVENEYLNYTHNIYAVALLACNVSVVEGFPGMLKADLTMIEFDPEPFLNKPAFLYDMHFVWPLFRWHYQRLLNGRTSSGDVLAPFVGDDVIEFSYLSEDALKGFATKVQKEFDDKVDKKMKEGERYTTWWDFNAKLENAKEVNKLFVEHKMPTNYEIVNIGGSFGNTFTPLSPSLTGKPTFQYFGSQDARFNILLHTTDRQVIASFVALKETVDRYTREYREGFTSSMLRVSNNFINMLGVKSVLMESLDIETIEGSPGSFYISISLISYDETQHKDEKLGYLDTIDMNSVMKDGKPDAKYLAGQLQGGDIASFDNNVSQAVAAEMLMDNLELYPDLELPTYEEVKDILKTINIWRVANKLSILPISEIIGPTGAVYVDPDFYFSYPSIEDLSTKLEDALTDPLVKRLALEGSFDVDTEYLASIKDVDLKDYFGKKTVAQIEQDKDGKYLKEAYEKLEFDTVVGENGQIQTGKIAARWEKMRSYISDPYNYTKRFWIKAWSGEGGRWETRSQDIEDGTDMDWKIAYYSKQKVEATVNLLKEDDYFNGMMHDMFKYDRRGTMMRAFPTYVLVIIDEGRMINVRKLWDKYYTYHSLSELSIHMDRKNPIHTAYLKLSNVYGALDTKGTYYHKLETPGFWDMVDSFLDSLVSNVSEKELLERAIVYDTMQLMAGARIHIRLGYGSCASQLPPVFNGIITEIDTGDMVTIVAQSFGYELTNEIGAKPGENNEMFTQGLESTELFRYYMIERRSSYTWAWRDSADPENYQSAYGIEHFGFLRVRDDQTLEDIFSSWFWDHEKEINAEDYDIMKNIYSSASYNKVGVDEDGVPLFDMDQYRYGLINEKDTPTLWKYIKMKPVDITKAKVKPWNKVFKYIDHKDKAADVFRAISRTHYANLAHTKIVTDNMPKDLRNLVLEATLQWAANDMQWNKNVEEGLDFLLQPIDDEDIIKEIRNKFKPLIKDLTYIKNQAGYEKERIEKEYEKHKDESSAGESNVRMQLEGKAPWDIFRVLERINPEYVVYPHIHQFGYTLFFGKPWWDVQCGYVLPPIKVKPPKYGKLISHYVELSKPFSQMHFYTAYGDIIGNNIKAVGSDLTTTVIPIFQLTDKQESFEPIWADYYMRGSFQKTRTIDTTLVQNVPWFPNWIEKGWTALMNGVFDTATKYQKYSVKFAQGVIAESFRDMYQGELVVFGDPTAKPYDVMYIDDFYAKMNGTAEMGRVTHHLSVETGFITTIKPDLCVVQNPKPEDVSSEWPSKPPAASGNFFRYTSIASEFPLQAFRIYALYKLVQFSSSKFKLIQFGKLAKFVQIGKMTQLLSTVMTWPKIGNILAKGVAGVSKIVKVIRTVKNVVTGARAAVLATSGTVGATSGPPGWIGSAIAIASVFATTFILDALESLFIQKYNNVIKIFPLFYHGQPYVAGINGHKQLIPGWEDDGNGKAQRVKYDNMPAKPPKKASESVKYVDYTGLDITAEPAKWLDTLSSTAKKDLVFVPPIQLGSEGKNYAGFVSRISSRFLAPDRTDHTGLDLQRGAPAKANDKFLAFADGEVLFAGKYKEDIYGTVILIRHTYKQGFNSDFVFFTTYFHASIGTMKITTGDKVKAGQVIARMGKEGDSRGEHLHFEILVPLDKVDRDGAHPIPKNELARKLKPGLDAVLWCFQGPHMNRTNISYQDPEKFIEQIIAYDSNLVKFVEYKG